MPAIRYVGPHDAVDVPALNVEGLPKGQSIDVGADLASNLLAQDVWELAPTKPVKES